MGSKICVCICGYQTMSWFLTEMQGKANMEPHGQAVVRGFIVALPTSPLALSSLNTCKYTVCRLYIVLYILYVYREPIYKWCVIGLVHGCRSLLVSWNKGHTWLANEFIHGDSSLSHCHLQIHRLIIISLLKNKARSNSPYLTFAKEWLDEEKSLM